MLWCRCVFFLLEQELWILKVGAWGLCSCMCGQFFRKILPRTLQLHSSENLEGWLHRSDDCDNTL
jgi:hypothetical protein